MSRSCCGDPYQDTRDRYGRVLAYVWLSGGRDLGYGLTAGGFAKVYVYRDVLQRHSAYVQAERLAKAAPRGLWRRCEAETAPQPVAPPPPPPASSASCHASYSPCLPIVSDLDCADVRALGKAPVRVSGSDPFRLDGDGDGAGCE